MRCSETHPWQIHVTQEGFDHRSTVSQYSRIFLKYEFIYPFLLNVQNTVINFLHLIMFPSVLITNCNPLKIDNNITSHKHN